MESEDEEKADMGSWSSGWEVITVYRRDTLIRAGVRYARHAAMLRSRRPRKCDGPIKPIKQKSLYGWGRDASRRTRKASVEGDCSPLVTSRQPVERGRQGIRVRPGSACQIRGSREASRADRAL
jgi:hypothetical protein